MAKKLADIESLIKSKEITFYKYLQDTLEGEIFDFINDMSSKTNVYIFSGIIRNYFLNNYLIRDIDLVIESEFSIQEIINKRHPKKNSFGGYKVEFEYKNIDIWSIENTWAFVQQKTFDSELESRLPSTAFFNFSAIVYSINRKEFIYTKDFVKFLQTKTLDYVFTSNANYLLCIINTFYYSDKYNLKIKNRLMHWIKYLDANLKGDKNYEDIQTKHFKSIIYTNEQIRERLRIGK